MLDIGKIKLDCSRVEGMGLLFPAEVSHILAHVAALITENERLHLLCAQRMDRTPVEED